jgi:predicted ABC-type ATPase
VPAEEPLPVLWICGPSGVGKSTAAWQLYTGLTRSGVPAAFLDTDQLGMGPAAKPDDPGHQRLKARNAGAMIPNYRTAGARFLIANGVTDPVRGVDPALPRADVTFCRLRADPDEVVRRFAGRHAEPAGLAFEIRQEAAALDASTFAGACLDTTSVPAAAVPALIRSACRDWPGFRAERGIAAAAPQPAASPGAAAADSRQAASADSGQILLICGPAGAGKSTIGFQVYLRCLSAGLAAAYVDLDQLGFAGGAGVAGGHALKAANLAAVWQNFRAGGARHLVAVGPVDDEAALLSYAQAVPAAALTVCRLHAGPAELAGRIRSRQDGGSWPQPGDPLRGQSAEYLDRVARQAAADDERLERAGIGTRIDTDGRTPEQAAGLIAAAAGWPPHRAPGPAW